MREAEKVYVFFKDNCWQYGFRRPRGIDFEFASDADEAFDIVWRRNRSLFA